MHNDKINVLLKYVKIRRHLYSWKAEISPEECNVNPILSFMKYK